MPEPAFDHTETAPDLGDVLSQVAGGQPVQSAPQAPQPAQQPAPQPAPQPPVQPVPQQPQAPVPDPEQPFAFGEEPWRQQPAPQPPAQPAAPAPPQETPDFLSYVAGKGFDLAQFGGEGADPQKVVDHLMEQAAAAQQYRRQLQFIQNQQNPPAEPPKPEPAKVEPPKPTGNEPPALSDADRWVMRGLQNGTIKESDLLPQQRASIEAWTEWRAKRAEMLVDRPMEVLRGEVEKLLEEQGFVRKDQIDSLMRESKEREFTAAVNQMYAPHFYVAGADGNPQVDPATGQPRLSEWGWKFVEAREYFSNTCGIKDPVKLTQAIIRSIGEPVVPKQPAAQPAPNGNGHSVPQSAPQPVPQPAATPQQTFVQAATQAATQFPPYPTADRGGVQGQPLLGTSPNDMTPPDINSVAQELLGPAAHGWR